MALYRRIEVCFQCRRPLDATSSWQRLVNIAWTCPRAAMTKKKRFPARSGSPYGRVDFRQCWQRAKPRRRLDSGRFGLRNGTAVATPRPARMRWPAKCLPAVERSRGIPTARATDDDDPNLRTPDWFHGADQLVTALVFNPRGQARLRARSRLLHGR